MKRRKSRRKSHYHRGLYESPIAGPCKYRSGWELSYMKFLDASADVVDWSYEKLIIEYISNAKTKKIRKYYPDFLVKYVDGTTCVIEIKPARRVHQIKVLKKSSAAEDWCRMHGATYKILTEVELKDMHLL